MEKKVEKTFYASNWSIRKDSIFFTGNYYKDAKADSTHDLILRIYILEMKVNNDLVHENLIKQ